MPSTTAPLQNSALLDLYEPLFQHLCRLNRAGRVVPGGKRGPALTRSEVRGEIVKILAEIEQRAGGDYRMVEQVKKLDLPVRFFIDSYLSESRLPFAGEWNNNRLAYEVNELAGDEKFFEIIDETLRDRGSEATERLAVLYVSLGLGFTGAYPNQPEMLRKLMNDIAQRIQHLVDADALAQLCPEAYQNVDSTNLIKPPGNSLAVVGILFACFAVAALVAFVMMYRESSKSLNQALDAVAKYDPRLR